MSAAISNNMYIYNSPVTKQTYIDKFDKSLKLPFLSVMNNNVQALRPAQNDEIKPDESDLKISDNVELSSAVTGATEVGK